MSRFPFLPLMLCSVACLAWSNAATGQDGSSADQDAEVQAIDLGILEVAADRWTYDQEIALRMIRQAYGKPRSELEEDRDKWVCWTRAMKKSRQEFLYCARNGDIQARGRKYLANGGPLVEEGYGGMLKSAAPVFSTKLERNLASIRGSDAFNNEFLELVRAGERPPRRIPNDTEMQQFAAATKELETAGAVESGSPQRAEIIVKNGLAVHRYNTIQATVDTYTSIRNQYLALIGDASPAFTAPDQRPGVDASTDLKP
jgi:hypothetical protein